MSDADKNKALFRRFMEEVANKKNLGAIDEFMVTDFVEHEQLPPGTPPGGRPRGSSSLNGDRFLWLGKTPESFVPGAVDSRIGQLRRLGTNQILRWDT